MGNKKSILSLLLICISIFTLTACTNDGNSTGLKAISGLDREIFVFNKEGLGTYKKGDGISVFHQEDIGGGYSDYDIYHLNKKYIVLVFNDPETELVNDFTVYDRSNNFKMIYEGTDIEQYVQYSCANDCVDDGYYDVPERASRFTQLKSDYGYTKADRGSDHFGDLKVQDWFVHEKVMYALTSRLADGKCMYFTAQISKGTKTGSIEWKKITTVKSQAQQDDFIDDYSYEDPSSDFIANGCDWKFGRNVNEFIVERWSNRTGQHYDIYIEDKKVDEIPIEIDTSFTVG